MLIGRRGKQVNINEEILRGGGVFAKFCVSGVIFRFFLCGGGLFR